VHIMFQVKAAYLKGLTRDLKLQADLSESRVVEEESACKVGISIQSAHSGSPVPSSSSEVLDMPSRDHAVQKKEKQAE